MRRLSEKHTKEFAKRVEVTDHNLPHHPSTTKGRSMSVTSSISYYIVRCSMARRSSVSEKTALEVMRNLNTSQSYGI